MISTKNIGKMISIHALVKRATLQDFLNLVTLRISIHALVKRATAISLTRTEMSTISIHALVKRATILLSQSITKL